MTDAERQTTEPVVEKGAGAEALFWTVHVVDEYRNNYADQAMYAERSYYHYIRLKVFNQKGKDEVSTINIEFGPKVSIEGIAARTIKPDGSIVEMKSNAVYERDLVRAGGRKERVKSFAVPAVEPGAIVEYRYTEAHEDHGVMYARLQLQREFPVRKVTYYVKPASTDRLSDLRMGVLPFNCTTSALKLEPDGYNSFSAENLPAFHDEPYAPAQPNVRAWALLHYRTVDARDPEKYWGDIGRKIYGDLKGSLKASSEIKSAATEAVTGASTPEEKMAALVHYVRKATHGFYDVGVTDAERAAVNAKKPKDRERTAAEVLKSGLGTSQERNMLLAAMAASVGLEARPVLLPSRNDILFVPQMADQYFLRNADVAVKIGDGWKFYDVSAPLPVGMLDWSEEGVPALLSDPKKPVFQLSPVAPAESSLTHRTAHLTLAADGTLEGDIEESYSGHAVPEQRHRLEGESEARQWELFKEVVTRAFPEAEVSAIALKNVGNLDEPLDVKYHIRIPGYAARTPKRILLQPLLFERAGAPRFTAAERRYNISFPYAWDERDEITIAFPGGFVLDNAENPGKIDFGQPGWYTLKMEIRNKNELAITRELVFGQGGFLGFKREAYPTIKAIFDAVHGHDTVTVTLRQSAGAP